MWVLSLLLVCREGISVCGFLRICGRDTYNLCNFGTVSEAFFEAVVLPVCAGAVIV